MRKLDVYNLEFPAFVKVLTIGDYIFTRVENYGAALLGLQHRTAVLNEFDVRTNTGTHQLTATVEFPQDEESAILPWEQEGGYTRLQDVLLLLSLFTGRNVFALQEDEHGFPLRPDPREHFYGGQFRLSAHTASRWRDKTSGQILTEAEMQGMRVFDYEHFDAGLEQTINEVLSTIATREWQDEYGNGYCLFLFRQAMLQHGIETAFMLCWTIWEHLFTLHKKASMDENAILRTSGNEKITFTLEKYFGVEMGANARRAIERLTRGRNRLVHYGIKPDDVLLEEMTMFIRLTEQLMSMVLRLKPSNALNSQERLDSFLKAA